VPPAASAPPDGVDLRGIGFSERLPLHARAAGRREQNTAVSHSPPAVARPLESPNRPPHMPSERPAPMKSKFLYADDDAQSVASLP